MSTTIRWPDGATFGKGLRQEHDVELLKTSAAATAASYPAGRRGPNSAASVAGRLGATPRVPRDAFRPILTRLGPAPRRTIAAACRLSGMHPGAAGRIVGSAGFKYI